MIITVKFFARLREELNIDETSIDVQAGLTALHVWQKLTGQTSLPPQTLIAVNQEYANEGVILNDNDEVAFFPPDAEGVWMFNQNNLKVH